MVWFTMTYAGNFYILRIRTETRKTKKYMIIYKAFYNILRLRKGMIPLE